MVYLITALGSPNCNEQLSLQEISPEQSRRMCLQVMRYPKLAFQFGKLIFSFALISPFLWLKKNFCFRLQVKLKKNSHLQAVDQIPLLFRSKSSLIHKNPWWQYMYSFLSQDILRFSWRGIHITSLPKKQQPAHAKCKFRQFALQTLIGFQG